MNKILLVLCLVCLPGFASAQKTVGWCDEIEMLGTWEVTCYAGDFKSLPYDYRELTPVSVTFSDGNYTTFNYDGQTLIFKGYWITTAKTDNCFLHLMPWNGNESIVNFRIQHFDNGFMVLRSYDGAGRIELKQVADPSAVRSTRASPSKGNAYGLDGVLIPSPENARGVVIEAGKKILR